jgi:hypothetical protein
MDIGNFTLSTDTRTETATIDDRRMYEAISIAYQFQAAAPRLLELLESMAGPGAREYLADIRQEEPILF